MSATIFSEGAGHTLAGDPGSRIAHTATLRPRPRRARPARTATADGALGSGAAQAEEAPVAAASRWSHPDDGPLVARILAGDEAAYATLVRRYQDGLFRFAAGMVGDPDLAADMVQEAFVKAYAGLERCRHPERFGAWVFRILVNRCKDHLKRRRPRGVPLEEALVAAPESDSPAAGVGRSDLREAVDRALATLPEAQREAFLLKHLDGRSYEEIAEMLGVSVGALKMRVMRAREALQARLRAWRT